MLVSIFVDLLWLFVYSPLRPIAWDTILSLSRKDQVRAANPLPYLMLLRPPTRPFLVVLLFVTAVGGALASQHRLQGARRLQRHPAFHGFQQTGCRPPADGT